MGVVQISRLLAHRQPLLIALTQSSMTEGGCTSSKTESKLLECKRAYHCKPCPLLDICALQQSRAEFDVTFVIVGLGLQVYY